MPFPKTEAACYDVPELMFPDITAPWGNPLRKPRSNPPLEYRTAADRAVQICADCLHLKACDDYATEVGPQLLPVGVYGGRDPVERRAIAARNAKTSKAPNTRK